MNKEFIAKLLKAEKYRYEAIKEILPGKLKSRVEGFEREACSFLRDLALEMIKEDTEPETEKRPAKKVKVDFS